MSATVMTEQEEKIETLERVIELMDECAELLRSLHDPRIDAYCLADFEGRERGWLGEFVRDIVEKQLAAWRDGDEDDENG